MFHNLYNYLNGSKKCKEIFSLSFLNEMHKIGYTQYKDYTVYKCVPDSWRSIYKNYYKIVFFRGNRKNDEYHDITIRIDMNNIFSLNMKCYKNIEDLNILNNYLVENKKIRRKLKIAYLLDQ